VVTPSWLEAALAIVKAVDDPELPHLTLGDLGVVRSVAADGETIRVVITPTYLGCPATDQIRDDVLAALAPLTSCAAVVFELDPPWTSDLITASGRRKLVAAGIAPPHRAVGMHETALDVPTRCPLCGSRRTRRVSDFGSTTCKAAFSCRACGEPFESFKSI
jgi:ring-1,2-phenylacetyl-CoA epoxidase subunit PaaD